MNTVVLARYKEDLNWITKIPDEFEVIIYNKGEAIRDACVLARASKVVERPNVGRESETYLHHMMTEVDANNSFTVYSQGDPFAHSPDFIELLHRWLDWKNVQPLSWQWREDRQIPPATLLRSFQEKTNPPLRVRPQAFSLTTWGPIDFVDQGALNMGQVYRIVHGDLPEGTNIAAHLLRMCNLTQLADKAERHAVGTFSYGAIFATRNDQIARFPKSGLENLLTVAKMPLLAYGYILERLWLHLFGQEFSNPIT